MMLVTSSLLLLLLMLRLKRLVPIFFGRIVGRLALEGSQRQCVFGEDGGRLQQPCDARLAVESALDLLPADELLHLFGQLPEFLKVYVAVGEAAAEERRDIGH